MARRRAYEKAPSRRPLVMGILAALVVVGLAWSTRGLVARLFPIDHTGVVMRISRFHKGGVTRQTEGTRQLAQFAMIFEDGFQCEGTDTSFAAIREGDRIQIRGYHDVKGAPIVDPEWWECDEAQLTRLVQ